MAHDTDYLLFFQSQDLPICAVLLQAMAAFIQARVAFTHLNWGLD